MKMCAGDARVLVTYGTLPDIDHVAAKNPDGSCVLVLVNRGGLEPLLRCVLVNSELRIQLPRNSVATLLW